MTSDDLEGQTHIIANNIILISKFQQAIDEVSIFLRSEDLEVIKLAKKWVYI